MTSTLDQALSLWGRGFSVIPVPRPRPGTPPNTPGDGKTPIVKWTAYQTRMATEAQLRAWFAQPVNIAIVTGAVSGVVVVDGDSLEAIRWLTRSLPYTAWQVQTGRGFHLYYRHPGVRIPNRARIETRDGRLDIDVRGDGGYVIAAGSVHASGAEYREAGDWTEPRDALPRFWPGWLQRPQNARTDTRFPPTSRPTGDVHERARRYLVAVPPPEIGSGSDSATLCQACRLVRGFALSAADAEALLWEWAGGRPGWTREWIARKVAHALRYGSEPIGALR